MLIKRPILKWPMDSATFNGLVALLASQKVRERNEALESLDQWHSKELNSRQFGSISNALMDLIQADKRAYEANPTRSVEDRLISAVHSLRAITSKALTTPKSVRVKHYINIVLKVFSLFKLSENKLFEVTTLQLARILSMLLNVRFIKDHLTKKDWISVCRQILSTISIALKSSEKSLVISELCRSLAHLIYASTHQEICVSHLFVDSLYLRILPSLRAMLDAKHDELLAILALQIISKLCAVFATEDTSFVSDLIRLGLQVVASHTDTANLDLQLQLCILLNIDALHVYASTSVMYASLETGNSLSITYVLASILRKSMLKFSTFDYLLQLQEFGLHLPHDSNQFFITNSLHLKDSTLNLKPWLLTRGVAKLSRTYFRLKTEIDTEIPMEVDESFSNTKRRKISNFVLISDCRSPYEYFMKLCDDADPKIAKSAFLLLAFLIETEDISGYASSNTESLNLNLVLSVALAKIKVSQLRSVSLFTIRALLAHILLYPSTRSLLSREFNQVLKICLSTVREADNSDISSDIIFLLSCTSLDGHVLDSNSKSQIRLALDLSEVNGPLQLTGTSFRFWYGLAKLTSAFGHGSSSSFAGRVQAWLFERWNDFDHTVTCNAVEASYFIAWLCGWHISEIKQTLKSVTAVHGIHELQFERLQLVSFIEAASEQLPHHLQTSCFSVSDLRSDGQTEELISRIISTEIFVGGHLKVAWYIFTKLLSTNLQGVLLDDALLASLSYYSASQLREPPAKLTNHDEVAAIAFNLKVFAEQDASQAAKELAELLSLISYSEYFEAYNVPATQTGLGNRSETVRGIDYRRNQLMALVETIAYSDWTGSSQMESCIAVLQKLDGSSLAIALQMLLTKKPLTLEQFSVLLASRLIRIIGETLLATEINEREEETFNTIAGWMLFFLPLYSTDLSSDLGKDCHDICVWFMNCYQSNLLCSERSRAHFRSFLGSILSAGSKIIWSREEVASHLLNSIIVTTNYAILQTSNLFSNVLLENRVLVSYESIINVFETPQKSTETAATFVYFLLKLGTLSYINLGSVLHSLIEFAKFTVARQYVTGIIQALCSFWQIKSTIDLFKLFRQDLIRSFLLQDSNLGNYPYTLFGYDNLNDFMRNNYLIIVGLAMAINSPKTKELVSSCTSLISNADKDVISDSISTAVALSFTKGGVRNDIFTSSLLLRAEYNEVLQNQLLWIIFSVVLMTDMSDEIAVRNSLKSNHTANFATLFTSTTTIKQAASRPLISSHSSLQLLEKLPQKYSDNFTWSLENVYLLVRRIFVEISSYLLPERSHLLLRQIKLVLLVSDLKKPSDELKVLLIKVCNYMLDGLDTFDDIQTLVTWIGVDSISLLNKLEFITEVMVFLSKVIKLGLQSHITLSLRKSLITFKELLDGEGPKSILSYALDSLSSQVTSISGRNLEKCIHDCIEHKIHIATIFHLFECLLQRANQDKFVLFDNIAEALLFDIDMTDFTDLFHSWSANYLAEFYLKDKVEALGKLLPSYYEHSAIITDFLNSVSDISYSVNQALPYCKDWNPVRAGAAELLLGGLFWKNDPSIKLDSNILNRREYIKAIDFSTIVQLTDQTFEHFGLIDFSSAVEKYDTIESVDVFLKYIYEAVLGDIGGQNSSAPLLAIFGQMVPAIRYKTLPQLLLHYIYTFNRAKTNVLKFVNTLCGSIFKPKFDGASEKRLSLLVSEIVVLIRAGALKNVTPFQKLYDGIDKNMVHQYCMRHNLPRAALLFLEDGSPKQEIFPAMSSTVHKIYSEIDCLDLLEGLPKDTIQNGFNTLVDNTHENNFNYGAGYLDTDIILSERLNQSMKLTFLASGYLGLAKFINRDENFEEPQSVESDYEWSWKLNSWSLPVLEASSEHATIYRTLKLIQRNPDSALRICNDNLTFVLKAQPDLHASWDSTSNWLRLLGTIRGLSEFSDENAASIDNFAERTHWFNNADAHSCENILLSRAIVAMNRSNAKDETNQQRDFFFSSSLHELTRYGGLTRLNKQKPQMIRNSILIDRLVNSRSASQHYEEFLKLAKFETARSLWVQEKTQASISMVKELAYGDIQTPFRATSFSAAYITSMLVAWSSSSKQDLAENLMDQHVTRVAPETLRLSGRNAEIFRTFGKFCESESRSRNLNDKLSKLERQITVKRKEIDELKDHYGKTAVSAAEKKSVQRYYAKLKSSYAVDIKNLESLKGHKNLFARKAAQFYMWSMCDLEPEEEDSFFSMWLNLADGVDEFCDEMSEDLKSIPSFQCVSWCTQLISRLSTESTSFQLAIRDFVLRVCRDHPYHSIYVLISLRKHEKYAKGNVNPVMSPKIKAANEIWFKLQEYNDNISEIQKLADEFADNSIKLAEYKVKRGKSIDLNTLDIGHYWTERFPSIPLPAISIPIDPLSKYENVVTMHSIDETVTVAATGLSLPKIAKFLLSDGTYHRALFKSGTDDLRQDSIMEQVFEKVNDILLKDKEARKRHLRVRTYKAVPLGPQAGIIEFVPNSAALIEIVKPYHFKYDKIKADKAREQMKSAQDTSDSERIAVFKSITEKVKPVLREFFVDTFVEPGRWFESRIAYTRGVATSSIVGYVLGLGDRHCNNILLDNRTGEPIHIDLGVAFDQGKSLPIPETVPFRLTRDMVDGFGISGVEGVFRKSSEHSFRAMQAQKDRILVILDVLRWDPLYTWSISPIRRKHLQEEADIGTVKLQPLDDVSEAGKAISTVGEKLAGKELSVEATIQSLVNEATSEENLALIYCGWCPFY